ncbi:hypothetical protein XH81_04175 [Bradyrhizobium sp. CCBAU 25360]|nr:hypothetical protein [Bradyrhizobium sp. CCBAU 25360]
MTKQPDGRDKYCDGMTTSVPASNTRRTDCRHGGYVISNKIEDSTTKQTACLRKLVLGPPIKQELAYS